MGLPRTHKILVRLTEDEYDGITRLADEACSPLAHVVRRIVRDHLARRHATAEVAL